VWFPARDRGFDVGKQCTWISFTWSRPNLTNWAAPTGPRKLGIFSLAGSHEGKAQGSRVVIGLANQAPVFGVPGCACDPLGWAGPLKVEQGRVWMGVEGAQWKRESW
jgi:hypothetical protein